MNRNRLEGRAARRLRNGRKFVVPMLGSEREGRLEPRSMTSSPYFFELGAAFSSLSQPNNNVSPLAILGPTASPAGSQSSPISHSTAEGSPVSVGMQPDDSGSGVLDVEYYRIANGVGLTSAAGETAPNFTMFYGPFSTSTSNASLITSANFNGTTMTFQNGQFQAVPWTVTATSGDVETSQIIDAGPGTGGPPSAGQLGTIEIVVNHQSTQSVVAPAIAQGGAWDPDTPLGMTVLSTVGTTGGNTFLTWNIAGDSPAGQQRYLVDTFSATFVPPFSSGPVSSAALVAVNITATGGYIGYFGGALQVNPNPGVSWSAALNPGGTQLGATVTFVTPFISQNLVTEATEAVSFNSTLTVAVAPGTAIPTGQSGAISDLDWTYTSTVSATSPIPLNGVGTPITPPPGSPPTPPPTPPPPMG